jgi:hypothetical protein
VTTSAAVALAVDERVGDAEHRSVAEMEHLVEGVVKHGLADATRMRSRREPLFGGLRYGLVDDAVPAREQAKRRHARRADRSRYGAVHRTSDRFVHAGKVGTKRGG